MPLFHLNRPARRVHPYYALTDFAKGYVEAMFFTNCDSGDERENLANELGVERLTHASIAAIARDCAQFEKDAAPLLALADAPQSGYSIEQAGRDFWFTRQGHGVGFWDRKELRVNVGRMPDGTLLTGTEAEEAGAELIGTLGDLLTDIAQDAGEVFPEIYRGWIYYR